ncbi:MAG: N-acetyl-gamma-glutamyl-phosphate reductase, partial [Planctomycetota bacterium]
MAQASIGIIGVSGYGGGETLRIAAQHPQLEITRVYGHGSVGGTVGDRYPAIHALSPKTARLTIEAFEPENVDVDVLIASLPTGQSRDALAKVPAGVKIVDIGGDHRLHHEDVTGWTFGLA